MTYFRSRTKCGGGSAGGYANYAAASLAEFPDLVPEPYVRPADWLALPVVADNEEKIAALVAVQPMGGTVVCFYSNVAYTVNWGDGSAPEQFGAGIKAEHAYDFNAAALAGTTNSKGYRQAVLTITPQSGGFGVINFQQRATTLYTSVTYNFPQPLLDLRINSLTATSVVLMNSSTVALFPWLESIDLYAPGAPGSAYMFFYMKALRKFTRVVLASGGTRSNWFYGCDDLEEVCDISMAGVTDASNMFLGCSNLKKPPVLTNSSTLSNVASMFSACSSLRTAPLFDTSNVTDMSSFFASCTQLLRVPAYNTSKVVLMVSTFNGCTVLEQLPVWDTANVTSMSSIFQNCKSLKHAPDWNTVKVQLFSSAFQTAEALEDFPNWNYAAATSLSSFLSGCPLIVSVPDFSAPLVQSMVTMFNNCKGLRSCGTITTGAALTNVTSMFASCGKLKAAPMITNLTGVTQAAQMYGNCTRMESIPAYSMPACTNVTSMFSECWSLGTLPATAFSALAAGNLGTLFSNCISLQRIQATGLRYSFSVQATRLSGAALNELFTNLPNVSSQTVTITNTPGSAAGSGVDRTIATAKGWTVSG